MINATNNPYPESPDPSPSKLDKGGYDGNAETLDTKIDAILAEAKLLIDNTLVGSTSVGSIIPSSVPPATGAVHAFATQAGTYTNWGGFVVPANTFAFISRSADLVFSISQTTLDVTGKLNISDIVNNLTSAETAKPLSAAQGKFLNDNKADLVVGKNKFNKNTAVIGSLVTNTNSISVNATYDYSDYIEVIPLSAYKSNTDMKYVCYYDINKTYVAGGSSAISSLINIPSNVYYIRITVYHFSLLTFQLELGTVSTSFEGWRKIVSENKLDLNSCSKIADIQNNLVSVETTKPASAFQVNVLNKKVGYKADLIAGKNKFNKLKTTANAISNLNQYIVNSIFIYSDFIPVLPTEVYKTSSNFRYTCFFNQNYEYVAGGASAVSQSITIPSRVYFMIVTSYVADIDTFQLELGTTSTAYESFLPTVNSSQLDFGSLIKKTVFDKVVPTDYSLQIGNFEWTAGSISNSTGVDETNANRLKTKSYIKIDKTKTISISKNTGYSYVLVYYNLVDSAYVFSGATGWYSTNTALWTSPLGDYVRVVFLKSIGDLIVHDITETGFIMSAYLYDYMTVATSKSVADLTDLVNSVVPFDFTKFNKAYIKNERLCCNDVNSASTAHYLGVETLTDKPQWMKAGVIWEEGITGGVAAIIANKNGLKSVSNITSKSLHIVFTDTKFDIGLFDSGVNAIIHTYVYPTACLRDNTTEYMFGFKVDSLGLTIYAKGETIVYNSITDGRDYLDYAGKYCTFEHFYTGLGKCRPQFNWIEVKDTNNEVIYDDFIRPMGLPIQNNTGYKYIQITNS